MDPNILGKRGQALEEVFFQDRDRQLLDRLRERQGVKTTFEEHGGSDADEHLIGALDAAAMEPEHLVALSLVPLLAVAWANGFVEPNERKAVLDSAATAGITPDTPAFDVLQGWLERPVDDRVIHAWEQYIHGLKERLGPDASQRLKTHTMGLARRVAAAAGGFLGVGSVAPAEEEMLRRLERAFDAA